MLQGIADRIETGLTPSSSAMISAGLLGLVAIAYLAMAFGVRYGEVVWSGSHIGRLPSEQRWWSLFYGVGLIGSALVLVDVADVADLDLIPATWDVAAGFVAACLLGLATLFALFRGTTWERMLFAPITFLGAGLAWWLSFIG